MPCPFLDGKHVVFGEVSDGFELLGAMDAQGKGKSGETKKPITIADCGQL